VLKRGPGAPHLVGDVVRFSMEDVRSGALITCEILTSALRRWHASVSQPYPGDVLVFLMFREEIEEIASQKYTHGESPPRLD
jgi:hypothetical protein